MPQQPTNYRTAMREDIRWPGYWCAWPLTRTVKIGDVVDTTSPGAQQATTLATTGIDFRTRPGGSQPFVKYDLSGSTDLDFQSNAESKIGRVATNRVGARVRFNREGALLVVFTDVAERNIPERAVVGKALLELWNNNPKNWNLSWAAVVSVVSAKSGLVVARSIGDDSPLHLSAKVAAGGGPFTVADLTTKFELNNLSTSHTVLPYGPCTPYFQLLRLKKSFYRRPEVEISMRPGRRGAYPGELSPVLLELAQEAPDELLETVSAGEQPPETGVAECSRRPAD